MKRKLALLLSVITLLSSFVIFVPVKSSAAEYTAEIDCKSAVLMEASTGRILYMKNPEEAMPPASVTKIMTLLLIMESLAAGKIALTDIVTASERASEMGGSQIFLKAGEEMTVEDLLKSIVIASANDAAVAMAEYIAGSEASFVTMMNTRAKELGMKNTHFENTNGLDDTAENHVTSAMDIAIMSRALLSHPKILDYTTLWMDEIRDGAFVLTNTNRLVRYYPGATGLKTGSTAKAGFCISATACRDGMHLIAVVMGASTRDTRNDIARSLLDFGFASYALYTYAGGSLGTVRVTGGQSDTLSVEAPAFQSVIEKGAHTKVTEELRLPDAVSAPVEKGDAVGSVVFLSEGKELGSVPAVAAERVEKTSYLSHFRQLLLSFLSFCRK